MKSEKSGTLKLSGPGGIRAHIKAIKIIMEQFQRRSQRSSRYTVPTIQLIPDHGNPQMRRTLFSRNLFKCEWVKYQSFFQVFEIRIWQTESDQETTRNAFHKPLRDIKDHLTRPFATASSSSYTAWNDIWWFPRNHLDSQHAKLLVEKWP